MGEGEGGRRESSSVLSLFRFHLSTFPPETPDTQAKEGDNLYYVAISVLSIPCEILSFIGPRKKRCSANYLSCYVSLSQALFGCNF